MKIRWTHKILFYTVCGMLLGCGSAAKSVNAKDSSSLLDELVTLKSFRIESDWARPLNTNAMNWASQAGLMPSGSGPGQVNLIGNPNFLQVYGDTVQAYLPYYGEQQMGAGYGGKNAIECKGIPRDYTAVKMDTGSGYDIAFKLTEGTESFDFKIALFSNLKSSISVTSSHRNPIRYEGTVRALTKERDKQ